MPTKPKEKLSPTIVLCRLTQLKAQQKYLDLDATNHILDQKHFRQPSDHEAIADILNLDEKLGSDFKVFCRTANSDASELHQSIRDFERSMISSEGVKKYKTNEYRNRAMEIDQLFCQRYEINAKTLLSLRQTFCEVEMEWLTVVADPLLVNEMSPKVCPAFSLRAAASIRHPIGHSDNEAVREFDEFLRSSRGYSGGWPDEEHNLFVKLKTKYKDNLTRICECMQDIVAGERIFRFSFIWWWLNFCDIVFVAKSREDIEKHNRWYNRFLELKAKRQQAIRKWKRDRFATFGSRQE